MATWNEVRRLALSLPETSEQDMHGLMSWRVRDRLFAWERPLRASDVRALTGLGREIPSGEILGARVEHEGAKLALVESDPSVYFTIPHFDSYNAILVLLERIEPVELEELMVESWLLRAPKRLASAYLAAGDG